jgi:hypothetical protein
MEIMPIQIDTFQISIAVFAVPTLILCSPSFIGLALWN